jgi:hypothetical protein
VDAHAVRRLDHQDVGSYLWDLGHHEVTVLLS